MRRTTHHPKSNNSPCCGAGRSACVCRACCRFSPQRNYKLPCSLVLSASSSLTGTCTCVFGRPSWRVSRLAAGGVGTPLARACVLALLVGAAVVRAVVRACTLVVHRRSCLWSLSVCRVVRRTPPDLVGWTAGGGGAFTGCTHFQFGGVPHCRWSSIVDRSRRRRRTCTPSARRPLYFSAGPSVSLCRVRGKPRRACVWLVICARVAVWSLGELEAPRGPQKRSKPTSHSPRTHPRIV